MNNTLGRTLTPAEVRKRKCKHSFEKREKKKLVQSLISWLAHILNDLESDFLQAAGRGSLKSGRDQAGAVLHPVAARDRQNRAVTLTLPTVLTVTTVDG